MKTNAHQRTFQLLTWIAVAAQASLLVQAAETNTVSLKVGHLPVTGHAKFFVAKEEGFFKDEGLNVELVEFANSADGLAALRAGKFEFSHKVFRIGHRTSRTLL